MVWSAWESKLALPAMEGGLCPVRAGPGLGSGFWFVHTPVSSTSSFQSCPSHKSKRETATLAHHLLRFNWEHTTSFGTLPEEVMEVVAKCT
jgi:hypothetical protein